MPVEVIWKEQKLTIADHEIFALGEKIEDIVTIPEVAAMLNGRVKTNKLARCFATIINFAGGRATPEEVKKVMIAELQEEKSNAALGAVTAILQILLDGAPTDGAAAEDLVEKK